MYSVLGTSYLPCLEHEAAMIHCAFERNLRNHLRKIDREIEAFLAEKTSATIDEDYVISPSYRAISEDDTRFDHNFCVEDALSSEHNEPEGRKKQIRKRYSFPCILFSI